MKDHQTQNSQIHLHNYLALAVRCAIHQHCLWFTEKTDVETEEKVDLSTKGITEFTVYHQPKLWMLWTIIILLITTGMFLSRIIRTKTDNLKMHIMCQQWVLHHIRIIIVELNFYFICSAQLRYRCQNDKIMLQREPHRGMQGDWRSDHTQYVFIYHALPNVKRRSKN